ncbi:hypothetical protein GC176_02295 [bacterium]|nr:hypothetical protein [bacterium]
MRNSILAMLALAAICVCLVGADQPATTKKKLSALQVEVRESLARFNDWIGEWRGVGQERRGSTRGGWQETGGFVWNFDDGRVGIVYSIEKSKHLKTGTLSWDQKSKQYTLDAVFADDSKQRLAGKLDEGRLVLESIPPNEPAADADVWRITFRQLNDKRMTVLYEKRRATQKLYLRVGEVGYTREGTRLAASDATGPECVVTGGAGTIAVTYKGEKYYVCCTGCRDAFNDDPEGIIAAYREQKAEEAAKKDTSKK